MAIKLRNGTWYCDFTTPDGQRVRSSLGTKDKKQALELHDRMKAEAWRTAKLGEVPVKTFDEACLRWLEEKQHKKCLDDDKSKIGYFLEHFAGRPLADINERAINQAIAAMTDRRHRMNWEAKRDSLQRQRLPVPPYQPKPVATATKASHLAFIRALLNRAATEWKWLEKAPTVKCPPVANKRIRWLTREEAQRLIDAQSEHMRPVVVFALATGLRRANIVNLEWSQIDMQRKVAWIHPEDAKAGKAIGVALNDTACSVLRGQLGKHSRWVFVHTEEAVRPDGTKTAAVRKMRIDGNTAWRASLKRAGIENFRFHDLRHTWASWLVQAGVPLSVLQEMGGWESIDMVRRYAHLAPSHLTEHARQIDAILGGNGTNTAQKQNGLSERIA
ncbi:tyrosine-type recombinase/integrase [Vogesella urethralis]|uniref:tyrosine-type recombinase/integrase n=1 Tax=Vogesella urethralis TaxID=2592656 RepID=UPI001186B7D6|nr:site-specific integrase [Vogesella urethralis]